jgi:hypothetical protein
MQRTDLFGHLNLSAVCCLPKNISSHLFSLQIVGFAVLGYTASNLFSSSLFPYFPILEVLIAGCASLVFSESGGS